MDTQEAIAEARKRGEEAARTAASWTVDGNTKPEAIAYVLKLSDDGDDISQYLPGYPTLSGEWADDLTPAKLYEEITGESASVPFDEEQENPSALIDALADAFEDGVAETFEDACVAELRKAATC